MRQHRSRDCCETGGWRPEAHKNSSIERMRVALSRDQTYDSSQNASGTILQRARAQVILHEVEEDIVARMQLVHESVRDRRVGLRRIIDSQQGRRRSNAYTRAFDASSSQRACKASRRSMPTSISTKQLDSLFGMARTHSSLIALERRWCRSARESSHRNHDRHECRCHTARSRARAAIE